MELMNVFKKQVRSIFEEIKNVYLNLEKENSNSFKIRMIVDMANPKLFSSEYSTKLDKFTKQIIDRTSNIHTERILKKLDDLKQIVNCIISNCYEFDHILFDLLKEPIMCKTKIFLSELVKWCTFLKNVYEHLSKTEIEMDHERTEQLTKNLTASIARYEFAKTIKFSDTCILEFTKTIGLNINKEYIDSIEANSAKLQTFKSLLRQITSQKSPEIAVNTNDSDLYDENVDGININENKVIRSQFNKYEEFIVDFQDIEKVTNDKHSSMRRFAELAKKIDEYFMSNEDLAVEEERVLNYLRSLACLKQKTELEVDLCYA